MENKKISYEDLNNASEEVQLEAVKQNGCRIDYIKNPSLQVQLEAVKHNGRAIQYIENPSLEVQREAIKQNPFSIWYIENNEHLSLELLFLAYYCAKQKVPIINGKMLLLDITERMKKL